MGPRFKGVLAAAVLVAVTGVTIPMSAATPSGAASNATFCQKAIAWDKGIPKPRTDPPGTPLLTKMKEGLHRMVTMMAPFAAVDKASPNSSIRKVMDAFLASTNTYVHIMRTDTKYFEGVLSGTINSSPTSMRATIKKEGVALANWERTLHAAFATLARVCPF